MFINQVNNISIKLSDVVIKKLKEYQELIKKWNGLDLVAKSTESDLFYWHFLESLSVYDLVKNEMKVCDFGAGGGVIGYPLACMGLDVVFVERNKSKLFFLSEILGVFCEEKLNNKVSCVVSRGVCEINNLLKLTPKVEKYVLFKGSNFNNELRAIRKEYNFDYEIFPRVATDGLVVVLQNVRKK